MVAYASSLDQIGPFGRSVRDVAIMLQTIAGHDPLFKLKFESCGQAPRLFVVSVVFLPCRRE